MYIVYINIFKVIIRNQLLVILFGELMVELLTVMIQEDEKDDNGNPFATLEDPEFVGPFLQELDLSQINGGVNFEPKGAEAVKIKVVILVGINKYKV